MFRLIISFRWLILLLPVACTAQDRRTTEGDYVKDHFDKQEVYIPMRDGKRLYTVIYSPKDHSQPCPFLMERTPYSAGPYGDTVYRRSLGPNRQLMRDGYIFVYQEVRGRYMSEGDFREMTPARNDPHNVQPGGATKRAGDPSIPTDESSDAWDTIDWLLKNVANNNGRVGLWGISYPGFYASASLPDAHASIKDIFGQGSQVVVRVVVRGTQKGALLGIPATGRRIHWDGVDIYRLTDGKISAIWAGDDWTAILYYTGTYKAPWIH